MGQLIFELKEQYFCDGTFLLSSAVKPGFDGRELTKNNNCVAEGAICCFEIYIAVGFYKSYNGSTREEEWFFAEKGIIIGVKNEKISRTFC